MLARKGRSDKAGQVHLLGQENGLAESHFAISDYRPEARK
jgi:hypothetical protein